MKEPCPHHWVIVIPDGRPHVPGVCNLCGAEKMHPTAMKTEFNDNRRTREEQQGAGRKGAVGRWGENDEPEDNQVYEGVEEDARA